MNPIYQQYGKQNNDFFQRFQQFQRQFNGNPQQIIQQMLNSGKITQAQFDNAVKLANQYGQFFRK